MDISLLSLQLFDPVGTSVWGKGMKDPGCLEQAGESRISIRESEHRMHVKLFLDEYPHWELGTPHQLVILHEMFLHTAKRGQKEAECMFHQATEVACVTPILR